MTALFAVLNVVERPTDIRSRLASRRQSREPAFFTVPVRRASPFFIISVFTEKDVVPWDSVARIAGGCADKMLLPAGISPPEDCPIKPFVPTLYPRRVLANTAIEILSLMKVPPQTLSLCLVDPCANLTGCLVPLVKLCGTVKIITRRAALFDAAADEILARFGAAVLVTDYPDTPRDSNVVIDCSGDVPADSSALVFSFVPRTDGAIYGADFIPSDYCTRIMPAGISSFDFAAALYELCSAGELATATYSAVSVGGDPLTLPQAAEILLSRRQL